MNICCEEIRFDRLSDDASQEQALADVSMINRLLRQLSSKSLEVDLPTIIRVLHNGAMVVARDLDRHGEIIGMGTIIFGYKLTANFASIEDVVVDEDYRRKGLGETITRALLEKASSRGVDYVDLTSNPKRTAANSMYRKIGFAGRTTNPYRLELRPAPARAQENELYQAAAR